MGTYSTGKHLVTVATTGTYDIDGFGAQGGGGGSTGAGGHGAEEDGSFTLTAGEKLEIFVGGTGETAGAYSGGGGGGGTFVFANTGTGGAYVPLLVAGGGGGGYLSDGGGGGTVAAKGAGTGGAAGNGRFGGGGGGSFKSVGSSDPGGASAGHGGMSLSGGFVGGTGDNSGGFGGGGGGGYGYGYGGGGGGGGYTGGSGGYGGTSITSTGGTSFLASGGTANSLKTIAAENAGNGSLIITAGVACYVAGTLILTDEGERAVEALAIGDVLVTASGVRRPVKWVGRRSYAGRFLAGNTDVQPVRFRAGSLGDGLPRRDLLVSPEHAMFLDGVLVPARCLVGDGGIVQERGLARVDYVHVELDGHDVILAEGAASESFADDGSRAMFHNAEEYAALYPDAAVGRCTLLPRLEEGPALDVLRRRLAGVREAVGGLTGQLDRVDGQHIMGWAHDAGAPERRVRLRVRDNGAVLGEVVADQFRADLAEAGIGDGCCAFTFTVPGGLSAALRHVVSVERASDSAVLADSPCVREAVAVAPLLAVCASDPDGLRGQLDLCTRERIAGWAYAPDSDVPVALQILDNGVPVARVLANMKRGDLVQAGVGTGRHAFDVLIPGGLSPGVPHVIDVSRESDGARIGGSPAMIGPADMFDDALESAVAAAVAGLTDGAQQTRVFAFLCRQAERLQQDRADGDSARLAREGARRDSRRWGGGAAQGGRRALVIDGTHPQPGQSGGANAILSHIAAMQRLGWDVSLVAADEMATPPPVTRGITVLGPPFYGSVEEVLRRHSGAFELVYLHRPEIASRYAALARRHLPDARLLYSVADLHHLRLARQAAVQGEPSLLASSRALLAMERAAAEAADAVLTHSEAEAAVLRRWVGAAKVHCAPWSFALQPVRSAFWARGGVAFVGSFGHEPNVDGAVWLVERVMPLVWERCPGLECVIAGRGMGAAVRGLARAGVTILGEVADLRTVYDRVRLTVAPLRFGAGVKSKVLESFAASLPCVMTKVAAEGIALPGGLGALVTGSAEEMAGRIVALHADEGACGGLGDEGVALVRARYSDAVVDAVLRGAIAGEPAALLRVG